MADDDEELTPFYDPDCMYRAVALLAAAISNPGKAVLEIHAIADVHLEYIDPLNFHEDREETSGPPLPAPARKSH